MKPISRVITLVVVPLTLTSCATTNKGKTIAAMIGAGIVAGTIDANLNNRGSSFNAHSTAVGLGTAAAVGAAAMYYFDDESKRVESDRKLEVAKEEIKSLRVDEPSLSVVSQSTLERDLPPEYKGLVQPGKWSIYKIDNWVSQSEGTFVHQDKMVRIVNPTFNPNKTKEVTKNE